MTIKIIILLLMFVIMINLIYGLAHLNKPKTRSNRLVNTLVLRISLSACLFLVLLGSAGLHWLQPHWI